MLGLYVPCAMARRCGGEWVRGKGAGHAAARGAKGRPRAGHANTLKGAGQAAAQSEGGDNIYALLDRLLSYYHPGNNSPASNKNGEFGNDTRVRTEESGR
jgi:hypothetical protein